MNLKSNIFLIPATDKETKRNEDFRPINYKAGDVKSQIASVVRHFPNYYKYQTLGEYNALFLCSILRPKSRGRIAGKKMQQGLLYIPLSEKEKRAGHPFKASLFGKDAGLTSLELHFENSKIALKKSSDQTVFKISRYYCPANNKR